MKKRNNKTPTRSLILYVEIEERQIISIVT